MQGTAYTFGDNIDTDVIIPHEHYGDLTDLESTAQHIFEPIRPDLADKIEHGDLLVAGEHFGCGSGREAAPAAIQAAGVGAVLAESFARIFYRTSIAIGFPAVPCPGITEITSEGDVLAVNLENNEVKNLTTGETRATESIPAEIQEIFAAGGLLEHLQSNPDGLRSSLGSNNRE